MRLMPLQKILKFLMKMTFGKWLFQNHMKHLVIGDRELNGVLPQEKQVNGMSIIQIKAHYILTLINETDKNSNFILKPILLWINMILKWRCRL